MSQWLRKKTLMSFSALDRGNREQLLVPSVTPSEYSLHFLSWWRHTKWGELMIGAKESNIENSDAKPFPTTAKTKNKIRLKM